VYHSTDCHTIKCHSTEWDSTKCHSTGFHSAECHGAITLVEKFAKPDKIINYVYDEIMQNVLIDKSMNGEKVEHVFLFFSFVSIVYIFKASLYFFRKWLKFSSF
jgi:hypothetical protein